MFSILKLGIFGRLLIAFLAAAMIPLLITWYFARDLAVSNARNLAELQLRNEAAQIAARTDSWLRVNHQSLLEHASTPAIRSLKPELMKGPLVSIATHQPWTTLAFVMGPDGLSIGRSDNLAPINYKDRDYFKATIGGRPIGTQFTISRTSGRPAWVLAVPIRDDIGNVIGVIAKSNGLTEITDALVSQRVGRTGRAMLIATDGKLLAKTGVLLDKEHQDFSDHPALKKRSNEAAIISYQDENRPVIAAVQRTSFDFTVAVQMDEAEVMDPVRRVDNTMLVLLSGAALTALVFAVLVAPTMARPIRRLTSIAEEISRGKFDHELSEVKRTDEIGSLARAIDRMTKSLRIAMTRLAERRATA